MNKLVYLHELDSVRNTPEEILRGQQAMYNEIVGNGNCVVLTYNQFTDSKAFLCAVKNDEQYQHILELFRKGYIKLSNFVMTEFEEDETGAIIEKKIDIYTPSQYIQHALEKNKNKKQTFIFSGMKLERDEIELMEIMGDALRYSNTSVFDRYEAKSDEDKDRVDELVKYTRMLLAISVEDLAYNPIKHEKQMTLQELMTFLLDTQWNEYWEQDLEFGKLFKTAIEILKETERQLLAGQKNARSNWLKVLYNKNETDEVKLAEAIVHLAYNYVVEDSIANVAKHYDDSQGMNDLVKDFVHRITIFWAEHTKDGLHNLHKPSNTMDKSEWNKILSWESFPNWETAVRVTDKREYVKLQEKENEVQNGEVKQYEDNYDTERRQWKRNLVKTIFLQIIIAFVYIICIHLLNYLTDLIEQGVDIVFSFVGLGLHPAFTILSNLVIYTVLLGVLSSYMSKIFSLPDILENIDDIVNSFKDIKNVCITKKYVSYVWLKGNIKNGRE